MSASFLRAVALRTDDAQCAISRLVDAFAVFDVDVAGPIPPTLQPLALPPLPPVGQHPCVDRFASLIADCPPHSIILLVGAGASVAAGIPDFRTPGTGLYDNLAAYDLPYAEAVFDIDYFRHTPAPFYQLCAEMWPGRYTPTLTHRFFKALYDRGKLLRCFTQNIDSLERQAGLPDDMIVAAHGNFDRAHVVAPDEPRTPDGSVNPDSRKSVDVEALKLAIMEGEAGWKRFNAKHGGLCKPAITFFGENLPRRFVECIKSDFPCCRLCLIFGSSLLVQPFASLVRRVNTRCPRMLINRERRGEYLGLDFDTPGTTDGLFLGDCDRGAAALAARLGWSLLGSNVGASEVPKCREAELTKIRLGLCKAATAKQAEHIILVEPTYKEIARAAANKLKISTRSIRRLVLKTSVAGYVVGSPLPMGDCRGHLKNDALVWVCTTPLASQSEQEYHGRID